MQSPFKSLVQQLDKIRDLTESDLIKDLWRGRWRR